MRAGPLALLVALSGCAPETPLPDEATAVLAGVRPEEVRAHMKFLAHDLLEGRDTGTRGYLLAAHYVAAELEAMGLEPAGDGATYFQSVPLRRATVDEGESSLVVVDEGKPRPLIYGRDFLLTPSFEGEERRAKAPLVFAGYGISAPELGYDDFAAIDAAGKLLVVLSGAPASFESTERAYYSSRDTKARIALERGAVGTISVQTPTDEARRPWALVRRYGAAASMAWVDPVTRRVHSPSTELDANATLSRDGAEALFEVSPAPLSEVFEKAAASEPPRFVLPGEAIVRTKARVEELESPNVVARLEGSDPLLKGEHVVFSAHLDHVGVGTPVDGDDVYNGAYDNASGVAVVLAVARAFSRMSPKPRRSLVFLAVTAEERGLLGSDYFARNPTVPGEIVANVNADGVLMFHPLRDVVAFGADHSTLLTPVSEAARILGLSLSPDFMPEETIFIRSDQYSFVRQGIPSVYAFVGNETGDPRRDGREMLGDWMSNTYHRPTDDMEQEMDFEAGADYVRLVILTGLFIANADEPPRWNEGDFLGEKFSR